MRKSEIDYKSINDKLIQKKAYKLSEVKDKLEIVAWDVCRFPSEDQGANLWQIQSADDGSGDYIVSVYEETEEKKATGTWEVVLSKTANVLDFYYKGDPIAKVATAKLGIPDSELASVERYLPAKLTENKSLVKALLSTLNTSTKQEVVSKYPELLKE